MLPAWGAYAQSAPPPDDVDVTLIGGGDVDSLVDTIRELVGRLGLTLTPHVAKAATDVAPATSARVTVEIDFTAPGEIVLSVRSDAAHAAGRRRIARDGSASVVREEVADAVSSMVQAQLMSDEVPDAGPVPSETAEPPPPPPPPPPPTREQVPEAPPAPPAPRTFAIDLTTFAGVGPFAGNATVVGRLGGGIVLASRRGLRPSLALTGEGSLPFESSADAVVAHTTVESVRAVAAIEILRSHSWLAIDVGVGFGFDLVSVDSTSPLANAMTYSPAKTDWMAGASIAANLALATGVVLTLTALGDVDLVASHRYVVQNGTGPGAIQDSLLFTPWSVRPAAMLGFTFTTFGDARFASRDPR
jgi:hypothetical protein